MKRNGFFPIVIIAVVVASGPVCCVSFEHIRSGSIENTFYSHILPHTMALKISTRFSLFPFHNRTHTAMLPKGDERRGRLPLLHSRAHIHCVTGKKDPIAKINNFTATQYGQGGAFWDNQKRFLGESWKKGRH
jgi:hypothetical protein